MTLGENRPPPNLRMVSDLRNEVRALDEARRLGRLEKSGNWTLDQCCQHLGRWIEFSIDGFPFQYPLRYRLFGRLVRLWSWMWQVALATRPGFRNPPSAQAVEPDQGIPDGAGVSYLLRQVDRIDAGERMTQPSPVEGPITHEQWWYSHLRHAELHLSFQHDQRGESGTAGEEPIDIELRVCQMLLSVAPAGLEGMFFEVGVPLAEGATTAPPPTKDEIEKMAATAPKYGIEIRSPGH